MTERLAHTTDLAGDPRVAATELTIDEVARGALRLAQPRCGYRFNIDALLLAAFAAQGVAAAPDHVVDLGSGCGIVGLLLAQRWPRCHATLVELQPELAELARQNARRNALEQQVRVVAGDLRHAADWAVAAPRTALVVTNPPFFRLQAGRASPNPAIALAKHELSCTLAQLLEALGAGLAVEQSVALIYPAARRAELLSGLRCAGITPLIERPVLALPGRAAGRVLVLGRRTTTVSARQPRDVLSVPGSRQSRRDPATGLGLPATGPTNEWLARSPQPEARSRPRTLSEALPSVQPPLVIHERPGVYSRELRLLLGEPEPGA